MARRRTSKNTAKAATAKAPARRVKNRPQVPFPHKLVLNQWLLSLLNVR